jgi:hypothetical protein
MRKRLIPPIPQDAPSLDEGWLDLDDAAVVEVTSEEKEYPVESALVSGEMRGWRAADSGTQTIRLEPFSRWCIVVMATLRAHDDGATLFG